MQASRPLTPRPLKHHDQLIPAEAAGEAIVDRRHDFVERIAVDMYPEAAEVCADEPGDRIIDGLFDASVADELAVEDGDAAVFDAAAAGRS